MVQFLSSPLYTDPADCTDDLTGKSLLLSLLLGKLGVEVIYKNVRPVGNLPFIGKSTERAVIGQLPDHCTAYAPLPNNQSSYRQGHSTETALLKVNSDMLMNMDKQEVTLVVLLNVSATFDTIDHKTSLEILETDFGVVGNAKKWTSSFLPCRTQRVLINQNSSKSLDIDCGVPQRSRRGPILIITYESQLGSSTSLTTTCLVSMRMQMIPVPSFICPSSRCRHLLNMMCLEQSKLVSLTFKLGHQPTQDKRYKNGVSHCGFPPTVKQGPA